MSPPGTCSMLKGAMCNSDSISSTKYWWCFDVGPLRLIKSEKEENVNQFQSYFSFTMLMNTACLLEFPACRLLFTVLLYYIYCHLSSDFSLLILTCHHYCGKC